MNITIPYYEDMNRISNSNIGWFIKKGPKYLKEMLNNEREGLKLPQLEKGTMIHEYILQPEEFWKDYIILDFEVPKVKQQKDFCEAYVSSLELLEDDKKLQAYRSSYTNTKSSQIALKEASELCSKYESYINYLKQKDDKKVISFADLNLLKTIKKNLEEHKKANELLYNFPNTFEVHNEFHINWEYPHAFEDKELSCKSLLDRVMIDHENKKIILIDLKTTADIYNFQHSVEEFDYYRQLTYYWTALAWYFKNELFLDIDEYEGETYIIAIQSYDGNEVRVFKIDEAELSNKLKVIDNAIKRIAWHKNNNLWEHTKEYYEGNGSEVL